MTIRYRCPTEEGSPLPGAILMGKGPRVRRAYRVLGATCAGTEPAIPGMTRWRLQVEAMSAATARKELETGGHHWSLVWDARKRRL